MRNRQKYEAYKNKRRAEENGEDADQMRIDIEPDDAEGGAG